MKSIYLLFIFLTATSLSSIANDEFDAIFVDGPGVFTGDKGHFSISNKKAPQHSQQTDEFALFKQWRDAKTRNTAEYQEFLDWQAYQSYKKSHSVND